jgi:hypothetical protein
MHELDYVSGIGRSKKQRSSAKSIIHSPPRLQTTAALLLHLLLFRFLFFMGEIITGEIRLCLRTAVRDRYEKLILCAGGYNRATESW